MLTDSFRPFQSGRPKKPRSFPSGRATDSSRPRSRPSVGGSELAPATAALLRGDQRNRSEREQRPENLRSRQPTGNGAQQRHLRRVEIEQMGGNEPTDHERQGAGTLGRKYRIARIAVRAASPTSSVVQWAPRGRLSTSHLLPGGVALRGRPRRLRQLPYRHMGCGAGQESGHDRAGEKLGDPPHPQQGEQEEQDARDQRDPSHEVPGISRRSERADCGTCSDSRWPILSRHLTYADQAVSA